MASTISMELPYRIALTFGLLFLPGFLMGFQFPSLIRMASLSSSLSLSSTSSASSIAVQGKKDEMVYGEGEYNSYNKNNNTTLLWGINIIASIIGTVIAVIVAMIIGFNGNLLIGLCMYLGAETCALFSLYYIRNNRTKAVSIDGNL
jgi:hypothetical protein